MLSGVDRIRLYVGNDYPYSNTRTNIVQISPDRAERLGTSGRRAGPPTAVAVRPADLGAILPKPGSLCFSSIQMVYNPRSVKEPLAILRADIDARRVQELVSGTSITENGLLSAFARGRGPARVRSGHSLSPVWTRWWSSCTVSCAGAWTTRQANGTDYYVQSKGIGPSGWRIASILPYRDVFPPEP